MLGLVWFLVVIQFLEKKEFQQISTKSFINFMQIKNSTIFFLKYNKYIQNRKSFRNINLRS